MNCRHGSGYRGHCVWRLIYAKNPDMQTRYNSVVNMYFFLIQRCKYVNPNCRTLKSTFQNVELFYFNLYISNSSNVNLH